MGGRSLASVLLPGIFILNGQLHRVPNLAPQRFNAMGGPHGAPNLLVPVSAP